MDNLDAFGDAEGKECFREAAIGSDIREDKAVAVACGIDVDGFSDLEGAGDDGEIEEFEKGLRFVGCQFEVDVAFFPEGKGFAALDAEGFLEIAATPQELDGDTKLGAFDLLADFDFFVVGVVHPEGLAVVNEVFAFGLGVLKAHHTGLSEEEPPALFAAAFEACARKDLLKIGCKIFDLAVELLEAVDGALGCRVGFGGVRWCERNKERQSNEQSNKQGFPRYPFHRKLPIERKQTGG